MLLALREKPVKNNSRLSSRLKIASIGQLERLGFDLPVLVEGEACQPAVRGDVLILFSDGLLEPFDLDLAGELRQLARMQKAAPVRVERFQQRGSKASRRAKSGTGRDISQRGDLDLRRPEPEQLDRLTDDGMVHLVGSFDVLQLRVLEIDSGRERPHDRHVDVFVDRRRRSESRRARDSTTAGRCRRHPA